MANILDKFKKTLSKSDGGDSGVDNSGPLKAYYRHKDLGSKTDYGSKRDDGQYGPAGGPGYSLKIDHEIEDAKKFHEKGDFDKALGVLDYAWDELKKCNKENPDSKLATDGIYGPTIAKLRMEYTVEEAEKRFKGGDIEGLKRSILEIHGVQQYYKSRLSPDYLMEIKCTLARLNDLTQVKPEDAPHVAELVARSGEIDNKLKELYRDKELETEHDPVMNKIITRHIGSLEKKDKEITNKLKKYNL